MGALMSIASRIRSIRSTPNKILKQSLSQEFESLKDLKAECCIDLQNYFVCIGDRVEMWERPVLVERLLSNKIRTLELLVPSNYCKSKNFISNSLSSIEDEVRRFDLNADSRTYKEGYEDKFLGYASALLPDSRTEIEEQFFKFFDAGGSIIKAQDRILPLTLYMLRQAKQAEFETADNESSDNYTVLMCAYNGYSVNMWVILKFNFDNSDFFCPVACEFDFSDNLTSQSVGSLISSILIRVTGQYLFGIPRKLIIFNDTDDEKSLSRYETLKEEFLKTFSHENIFTVDSSKKKGAYFFDERNKSS